MVVDTNGEPLVLYRGGVGDGMLLNAQPRPGYAVFASPSSHVAASYPTPTQDALSDSEVGGMVPIYVKAHELIECPVKETNRGQCFDDRDLSEELGHGPWSGNATLRKEGAAHERDPEPAVKIEQRTRSHPFQQPQRMAWMPSFSPVPRVVRGVPRRSMGCRDCPRRLPRPDFNPLGEGRAVILSLSAILVQRITENADHWIGVPPAASQGFGTTPAVGHPENAGPTQAGGTNGDGGLLSQRGVGTSSQRPLPSA